jgi:hypothetical protein
MVGAIPCDMYQELVAYSYIKTGIFIAGVILSCGLN